jgi:hypothetical protein
MPQTISQTFAEKLFLNIVEFYPTNVQKKKAQPKAALSLFQDYLLPGLL